MAADYTRVRRLGNQIAKRLADEKDLEGAKEVQAILRKRGVPLQASGYAEALPRDVGSRLPLVEEGTWPTTPIMLNEDVGHVVGSFLEDAQNIHLLSAKGISSRLGLLLYGPPGTGKSLLAAHIASKLQKPLYVARIDSLISSKLGETSKNIRGIFDFISSKQAVLFLDEMDAIAKLRDDRHELGELKRVVNAVLQGLDSLTDEIVTIGATNHPHLLDPAIWRRFPYKVDLAMPDVAVREAMWVQFLYEGQASTEEKKAAQILAKVSKDLSGADIENVALGVRRRAALGHAKPNLSQILLAVLASRSGNPRSLDNREMTTADKKALTAQLHNNGDINPTDIACIIGVSRQMVYKYLKDALNG